jgi:hypothetical protein
MIYEPDGMTAELLEDALLVEPLKSSDIFLHIPFRNISRYAERLPAKALEQAVSLMSSRTALSPIPKE